MDDEAQFMRRAIEIAERGRHRVMPNPLVGCVLVKDGEIIAEGWHDHIGGLHAEQMAIADAEAKGVATQGSTAYVTLEPCNHFGRTPPCTEALLWAGVKRVVIGADDPNPTVRGDGASALEKSDVEVESGLLAEECGEQMGEFMHWCENMRPEVLLKAAIDANGRVDCDPNEPAQRFSSPESLEIVHALRADSMAILVGVDTVVRDDPSLTVRGPDIGPRNPPTRVVIDPSGRLPTDCKLLNDGKAPTLLIHAEPFELPNSDAEHVERAILSASEGEITIARILDYLGDRGIQSLLVEGGPNTWRRFLAEGLVDRAHLCQSPVELSGNGTVFSKNELSSAGLKQIREIDVGGDRISHWRRED